jgi:hypothetical protein
VTDSALTVAFVVFFALFCTPGLPLGWWLCGRDVRRHPEALAYGLLLGHVGGSAVTVGLAYLFGFSALSLALFVGLAIAWGIAGLAWLGRDTPPRLRLPPWDRRAYAALGLLLLVAAALVVEPFAHVGHRTPAGYAYRKYFIGDFLKEVAVTAELARGEIPPQNPWFAGEALHYYWLYFVAPAAFHRLTGNRSPLRPVLLAATALTGAVFLFVLLSTLRLFTTGALAPLLAALIGVAACSYEGPYLWWRLGEPFGSFLDHARGYNIDGLTRWLWGEPQLDGFFRSLLYTPQHLEALTLLLATVSVLAVGEVLESLSLSALVAAMMGASVGLSAFIGLVAATWYACHLTVRVLARGAVRHLMPLVVTGGVIAFAVLACYRLEMLIQDPDSGLMLYTGKALKSHGPLLFLMNYGPPCIFGGLGIVGGLLGAAKVLPATSRRPAGLLLGLGVLLALGLTLIWTVAVRDFLSDVGLKVGLVVLAVLLIFTAMGLDGLRRRLPAVAFGLVVALVGAPALVTVVVDRVNSADIDNTAFTLYVSREDAQAAAWIRTHVPDRAIVQASPRDYSPVDFFSLIPILGERRTAVGDPFYARIFLVSQRAVERRRADIARLFETESPREALDVLHRYRIAYVYVGPREKAAYRAGVQKFSGSPELFEKVYENSQVDVFRLRA